MNFLKSLFVALILVHTAQATDKILIITHSYNRPDFIAIQDKTFKTFLEDDYEFVVFNDGRTDEMSKAIANQCSQLNLRCIRIPQVIHRGRDNACERCADVVQFSLKVLGFDYPGIVFIIDSDMFLIKPLNITNYLKDYDLFGTLQHRRDNKNPDVTYVWNGLVFMDNRTLPDRRSMNWDCGRVNNQPVDVGGQMHHYLKKHPELRVKHYVGTQLDALPRSTAELQALGYDDLMIWLIQQGLYVMELHAGDLFLHYHAGGNWNCQPPAYHLAKTKILHQFLNTLLADGNTKT